MIQPLLAIITNAAAFSAENGPLENLQVFFLFLILIISGIGLFRRLAPEQKLSATTLILLSISMILRELDVEDLPVPAWVIWVGSGTGRNFLITAAWLALARFCAGKPRLVITTLRSALDPRTSVWFIVSATLLLLGAPFDHKIFGVENLKLIEELLECGGYLSLLIGSLRVTHFYSCGPSPEADVIDKS